MEVVDKLSNEQFEYINENYVYDDEMTKIWEKYNNGVKSKIYVSTNYELYDDRCIYESSSNTVFIMLGGK